MKRALLVFVIAIFLAQLSASVVFAKSSYVLPYPSIMPGSFLYKPKVIFEQMSKYWYFGDFAQFSYNLKLADKYLVEAKTLFEYDQYLLAADALGKSDFYFDKTVSCLRQAKDNNKNTSEKQTLLKNAAEKHREVLKNIREDVPELFTWAPEKAASVTLSLHDTIDSAILKRNIP